jgi:hypothetical protein
MLGKSLFLKCLEQNLSKKILEERIGAKTFRKHLSTNLKKKLTTDYAKTLKP